MTFPAFFDEAPVIRVRDGLAKLLGTATDGVIEYSYADAARLAGHSAPPSPAPGCRPAPACARSTATTCLSAVASW